MSQFQTKDSGKREDYASGMRRDTQEGKPRYDLVDLDFLTRWAELMGRGADKYGEDNWRLASSDEELRRFKASAFRHFIQWIRGDIDEDHASAVAFNIAAAEMVKGKLSSVAPVPDTKCMHERYCTFMSGHFKQCMDCGDYFV